MQTLTTYSPALLDSNNRSEKISMILVFAIHAGLISTAFWTSSELPLPSLNSAPKVMDIALLTTAPATPPSDLEPGPQQVEAAAAPKPEVKNDDSPELLTNEKAEHTINTPPPEPKPVHKEINEEPPEDAVKEQVAPAPAAPETTAPTAPTAPLGDTAAASTAGVDQQQLLEAQLNWQQLLQIHLEKRKRYPRRAQLRYQEGVPLIRFSMNRSGEVISAELVRSSGFDILDQEALALIKRAQPLPGPPVDLPGDTLTLTVPIEFFIRN